MSDVPMSDDEALARYQRIWTALLVHVAGWPDALARDWGCQVVEGQNSIAKAITLHEPASLYFASAILGKDSSLKGLEIIKVQEEISDVLQSAEDRLWDDADANLPWAQLQQQVDFVLAEYGLSLRQLRRTEGA